MGDGAGNYAAGLQSVEVFAPAAALGGGPGEKIDLLAVVFYGCPCDDKAGGTPDTREYGNVLDGFSRSHVQAFVMGHIPPLAAELKAQTVLIVVGQGGTLQDLARCDAMIQFLFAQVIGVSAKAFGTIFQHFRFLVSCDFRFCIPRSGY